MASNRAATLPDAAALLAALVHIVDAPDMTVSSSGMREGLPYQALDDKTRAQDTLIVVAEFEGRSRARFVPHGRAVADGIADRTRVVEGKRGSGRGDYGGRRVIKKKKNTN